MPVDNYADRRRRPRIGVIILIVLLHLAALYGLARAFAPDMTTTVERTVVSAFTVTVTTPDEPDPPPEPEPQPDEGAAGDPGKKATPRPVTAPTPKIPVRQDRPMPRASSTGTADTSGAKETGDGTGAAGEGLGTGSGRSGGGRGGIAVTKPELIRAITDASAFPVPPGGRQARIGKSVIVRLSVSAEGRVTGCSVYEPSPFPETDAMVCTLAREQVLFEPARDANGDPVAATFFYRQRFFN